MKLLVGMDGSELSLAALEPALRWRWGRRNVAGFEARRSACAAAVTPIAKTRPELNGLV